MRPFLVSVIPHSVTNCVFLEWNAQFVTVGIISTSRKRVFGGLYRQVAIEIATYAGFS
ncbi:MAG: hypothetical protein HFACDABA_02204 [Anaerolineales bacterium]|nr:hypothetical protein [Anaerolineales bacterium]